MAHVLTMYEAGFGYAFEDEKLADYGRPAGLDDFSGKRKDVINRPLVNHPGETFQYGTSMDWVGIVIERITKVTLEEYFQQNIFQPLSMEASFFPAKLAKNKFAYMHQRLNKKELIHADHIYRQPLIWDETEKEEMFCAGGHGCFAKPLHFLSKMSSSRLPGILLTSPGLIAMLLNDGVDEKTGKRFLEPETVQGKSVSTSVGSEMTLFLIHGVTEMFKDQIPDTPRHSHIVVPVAKPLIANPTPLVPMPEDHTEGWGLSFSLSHFPEKTGRAAGSASWEGAANLYWFADRTNNVAAIIGTQILPYGGKSICRCQSVPTEANGQSRCTCS